jgi:large subunit ribosomal protein L21
LRGEVKLGGSFMKYAIVADGGKQYKVVEGGTVEVDYFEAEAGETRYLDQVLMVVDFRYRPKKRYRVKTGHRQKFTRLQIDAITQEA